MSIEGNNEGTLSIIRLSKGRKSLGHQLRRGKSDAVLQLKQEDDCIVGLTSALSGSRARMNE